jgi:hypothetical protein
VAVRDIFDDPLALWTPSPEPRPVGFDPGFVEEDQPVRVDACGAEEVELEPRADDVRSFLLCGVERFFLKVSLS